MRLLGGAKMFSSTPDLVSGLGPGSGSDSCTSGQRDSGPANLVFCISFSFQPQALLELHMKVVRASLTVQPARCMRTYRREVRMELKIADSTVSSTVQEFPPTDAGYSQFILK